MSRVRALALLLAVSFVMSSPGYPQVVRPAGTVGRYVPPRPWPVRVRSYDLLHQRIALSFDLAGRTVQGEVVSRVIMLGMPSDTVRLDAAHLVIDGAKDAAGRALRYRYDTSSVTVRLRRRAAPGDTVEFSLRYHAAPERGIYFVPRRNVIWTQGEATETRAWVPTFDAPNDKTTWEFLVSADSGMRVLSNGRLVEITAGPGGAQRVWHWAQEQPASTYLYSVVVGPFQILRDRWRELPVEYWVYPDTVDAGWRAFGETPSMIELYSRLLGVNFPWAKYSQSAVPDFTYGGMENVSATTQSDLVLHSVAGEPEANGRGLVAHELAHQWFGDLTTTANWAHAWLNEGLATYLESVQEEKSRGWEAAQFNWWGQQQAAMAADQNLERPLVWGEYQGADPIVLFFSGHLYPKGAQVAHQLRRLLGDSLFWAGLHRFLISNAYQPVETSDLAIAFEETCRCELDWFFDQWAYGIGYPRLLVTRHWDDAAGRLRLTVQQTQRLDSVHPVFRFPATVRVITRDSVVRRTITVSKASEVFELAIPGRPLSVRFDEGGWLLGTVTTDMTPAELAEMARSDQDFSARLWALHQLDSLSDSVAAAARRFILVSEDAVPLRVEALRQLARDTSRAATDLARGALRDPDSRVRTQALNTLSRLDSVATAAAARFMYESDPSTAVRVAALGAYARGAGPEAIPGLIQATSIALPTPIRQAAAERLRGAPGEEGARALERMLDPSEPRVLRIAALNSLAELGDGRRASAVAATYLRDPDPLFAVAAARVLGQVGGQAVKSVLRQALGKERRVTVRAALRAALAGG